MSFRQKCSAALAGDLREHHPGGHRRIQRFDGPCHRNRHHSVAGLADQLRQTLALRPHHDSDIAHPVEVVELGVTAGVKSDDGDALVLPVLQGAGQIRGTRDRKTRRRTRTGAPGNRGDRRTATLGMTTP